MTLSKASDLNIHTHPTHTPAHTPHTRKEQANHLNFHFRTMDGILITIKLTEDVPDQKKAKRVIDSRHEYTLLYYM